MNNIFVTCPHCSDFILIEQINPHETEENCNYLIKNDLIFGCGKPFRIITNDTKYIAIICDYI